MIPQLLNGETPFILETVGTIRTIIECSICIFWRLKVAGLGNFRLIGDASATHTFKFPHLRLHLRTEYVWDIQVICAVISGGGLRWNLLQRDILGFARAYTADPGEYRPHTDIGNKDFPKKRIRGRLKWLVRNLLPRTPPIPK